MAYWKNYDDYFILAYTNIYWVSVMMSLVLAAWVTSYKLYKNSQVLLSSYSQNGYIFLKYNGYICIRLIFVYTDNARCALKAPEDPLRANEKSLKFF